MRLPISIALLTLLLGQIVLPSLSAAAEPAPRQQGRVIADRLNLRAGPGTETPVIGSITRGTIVRVGETREDWLQITLDDGKSGWVAAKYIEMTGAPPAEAPGTSGSGVVAEPSLSPAEPPQGSSGSVLGSLLKWGCLVGAGAVGYLAYNEHTQGNDAYNEYKDLVQKQGQSPDDAEFKRQEAIDHDGNANTYAIASGALFGAFLIQQFLLPGRGNQAGIPPADLPFRWDPERGEFRTQLTLARF